MGPSSPLVPGARHVPLPHRYRCDYCALAAQCSGTCADEIERLIEFEGPETIAAIIMEPVQNSGGAIVPPPGYLQHVRQICDHHGILMIADEVICGFGRVGSELAAALTRRGLSHLVIEYNPVLVRELRARGVAVVYGDAANPAVQEHAQLARARLLAVLMPDISAAELTTRHARAHYPDLEIVVRVGNASDVERLQRAGATAVVQPEFEAAVEVIRHTMQRYGIIGMELAHLTAGRRAAFYRRGPAGNDRRPL
jgi:hypothetical protein